MPCTPHHLAPTEVINVNEIKAFEEAAAAIMSHAADTLAQRIADRRKTPRFDTAHPLTDTDAREEDI